jgi:hypothetical protein
MAAVKLEGKWGFINKQGNFKIKNEYDQVGDFSEKKDWVYNLKKYGYINTNGDFEIKGNYRFGSPFKDNSAIVKSNGRFGLLSQNGDWIIPLNLKKLIRVENYLHGMKNRKWALFSEEGKRLTPYKYYSIESFSENLALVRTKPPNFNKRRYGFINEKGKAVIKPQFYRAGSFSNGLAKARDFKERWGYINNKGKFTITPQFSNAESFNEGKALVTNKSGFEVQKYYIDINGKTSLKNTFTPVSGFYNGRAIVQSIANEQAIQSDVGPDSVANPFLFENRLTLDDNAPLFNYIDSLGNYVLYNQNTGASVFESDYAFVKRGDKWALVNIACFPITSFKYDKWEPFKDSFAKVGIQQHFGLANSDGKILLECIYEKINQLENGIYQVISGNQIGYFHYSKGWIWNLQQ